MAKLSPTDRALWTHFDRLGRAVARRLAVDLIAQVNLELSDYQVLAARVAARKDTPRTAALGTEARNDQ